MNRVERLFGILIYLQSQRYIPAEKIGSRFGISVRTVYRDIKALNSLGIPVGHEPQQGYFIMNGYFLPPLGITTEEANSLLLVEALVKGFADQSVRQHLDSLFTKIKSVAKQSQRAELEKLQEKIRIQVPPCLNSQKEFLSGIQQAISANEILAIIYQDKSGNCSKREIEPVGLVFYALTWHLIAWCHLRNEYRDFKVLNIESMRRTGISFRKHDHVSLEEYMKLLPVSY
jgi:predicted DNA-binding transcriptional regulator YafY